MKIEPLSMEQELRIARLKFGLKDLPREELEQYAARLIEVCEKLTHQTKQLLKYAIEKELEN